MEVHIFDVEHGDCALVLLPSGESIMIDCGHNSSTGWRPSQWTLDNLSGSITNLTVTNPDEDHVSDLPNLYKFCEIKSLRINWNIDANWIRRAKALSGIGPGIQTLINMVDSYTGAGLETNWGGVLVSRYCLSPPQFNDENSLSVVTFLRYEGIRIVFPGDLTAEAWIALMNQPGFIPLLQNTNIFVASHHGREDGYCRELFNVCKPSIIIISDKGIIHETQKVNYSQHAVGIVWNETEERKVLTTRADGKLKIESRPNYGFYVTAYGT